MVRWGSAWAGRCSCVPGLSYVIAPELSGRLLLHSAPAGAQAVEGERPLAQTPIHFCVWHGLPRAVERMADFNAALRELVREGVVARLVERERQRQRQMP
ncbi:MAG: hypothetical protein DI603_13520 [Roseateles depolymerans]|uniref:Uncharacterized protein n=1 Tax=Roseateles depolymerans TaxID=76731 RepID=A0A2W5FN56_9BURK|nr:MAG: hypothetical protein DI603_13520 [Roseateles depolymerans]